MTATRPARAQQTRTVRLVRDLTPHEPGVIRVAVGSSITFYTIFEITCEIGGRGFVVHKLGLGTVYHVRVGEPADCSCECLGYLRHGYCRHLLGLLALLQAGKLDGAPGA